MVRVAKEVNGKKQMQWVFDKPSIGKFLKEQRKWLRQYKEGMDGGYNIFILIEMLPMMVVGGLSVLFAKIITGERIWPLLKYTFKGVVWIFKGVIWIVKKIFGKMKEKRIQNNL